MLLLMDTPKGWTCYACSLALPLTNLDTVIVQWNAGMGTGWRHACTDKLPSNIHLSNGATVALETHQLCHLPSSGTMRQPPMEACQWLSAKTLS